MKSDSIAFAVAGIVFGFLAGWLVATQWVLVQDDARPVPAATAGSAAPAPTAPPPLDEAKVKAFQSVAENDPANAEARVQLGNLYFDAERFDQAIEWYTQALKLAPGNVDVSTDLGVSYYYTNQPDRALAQFEQSLKLQPTHTKTILNVGIVKAFGKQDLEGAESAWRRVIELAPNTPEGQAAQRALDSLRAAHPGGAGTKPGA